MPTLLFDFDSTLISCESLEMILKEKIKGKADLAQKIHEITEQGMGGQCTFADSLAKRLAIAQPTKREVEAFANEAPQWLTSGMMELVKDLQKASVNIWIISGALRETLLPSAKLLDIPSEWALGVQLNWNHDGSFAGIDPKDPFSQSKVEGARRFFKQWDKPIISIGDGMTDYALLENQLVDDFIAFTQYARRQNLINKGVKEAKNSSELRQILGGLLNVNTILSKG